MLGLRTTIYKVPDLAKAKAWYAQAFKTEPYFDEAYYVGFDIGGYELGLMPDPMRAASKTDNVLSYWGVLDVPTELARLIELGAILHNPPTDVGDKIIVAAVKDPFGNVIGLIDNPGFAVS